MTCPVVFVDLSYVMITCVHTDVLSRTVACLLKRNAVVYV